MQQRLVIVGPAQVGKTKLLKKLLKDVRSRYDFIFYVSLEYIDCSDEMNILKFLVKDSSLMRWIDHKTNTDFQMFKRVVERLHGSKHEKVCIILDDLEKFMYENYVYDKGFFETTQAGFLVSNILRHWFQNGTIILLLRPWQYFQLNVNSALSSFQIIYVQGVGCEGGKELLGNVCLEDVITKQSTEECTISKGGNLNNCHREIQSLCYIPNNCKMLVEHYQQKQQLQEHQKQQQAILVSSPVAVAAKVLIHGLLNAYHKKDISLNGSFLDKISKFAWDQYKESCFIFDESDLVNSNLNSEELNIFFTCYIENSPFTCGSDFVFFFSHILQQELLAAVYLLSLSSDDFKVELDIHRESFLDGSFAILCDYLSVICTDLLLKKYQKTLFSKIHLDNLPVLQEFLGKYNIP